MNAKTVIFDLGKNVFGQPCDLTFCRDYMGRAYWSIVRNQADQRDDTSSVSGLTADQLKLAANCIDQMKGDK